MQKSDTALSYVRSAANCVGGQGMQVSSVGDHGPGDPVGGWTRKSQ